MLRRVCVRLRTNLSQPGEAIFNTAPPELEINRSSIFRNLARKAAETFGVSEKLRGQRGFLTFDGPLADKDTYDYCETGQGTESATTTILKHAVQQLKEPSASKAEGHSAEAPSPFVVNLPNRKEIHGHTLRDPYWYLEDPGSRERRRYISREQEHWKHADERYDFTSMKLQLNMEADSRMVCSTRSGGFDTGEERIGDFIYFTRTAGDDTAAVNDVSFYRKRLGQADSLGEELINPNELRRQFGYASCTVGVCRVSSNGQYLAYTLSVEGGDRYICHLKSVDNASLFHVIRAQNIVSIEFGSGNHFFYTECNELNRPYRVMCQEIQPGLLPEPFEVYRDDDEEFFVDVRRTKDSQWLVVGSDSKSKGTLAVLPASYPYIPSELVPLFQDGKPREICGKEAWGWLEHHEGNFIMVTNSGNCPNYKIVFARAEEVLLHGLKMKADRWKTLVPHDPNTQIIDVDIFKTHLCIFDNTFRFQRPQQIRVLDIRGGLDNSLDRTQDVALNFPPLTHLTPGLNRNWEQDSINFSYSSIIQPVKECVFNFQTVTNPATAKLLSPTALYTQRQHELFTPWDYQWPYSVQREMVTGHDGAQIPLTLFHKRDINVEEISDYDPVPNAPKRCLIIAYGAYGDSPPLHFQLLPYVWLLRRRWVIAFAHIRGGGEKGLPWAEAGRGRKKMNSVRDFISCCEFLSYAGYTTPSRLVASGASAGAVPIAAAMNMRGNELFDMALLRAPFLDIANTMLNPDLPLSLAEREDWGDPLNSKEDLEAILEYDPYQNISNNVTYPSMMISTCLDDERVPASNALKYVARIREARAAQGSAVDPIKEPILLRCATVGGHNYWNEWMQVGEEIGLLQVKYWLGSAMRKVDDMDTMSQATAAFETGLMDHDDARQIHVKWEAYEQERSDYMMKLNNATWDPNFRQLKAEKEQYFWHQTGSEQQQAQQSGGHGFNAHPGAADGGDADFFRAKQAGQRGRTAA